MSIIKSSDKIRLDWHSKLLSYNLDALDPGLFSRSLEFYVPGIVQQDTPPADIESIVFHSADLPFGATEVTSTYEEAVGEASFGFFTDDTNLSNVREFEEGAKINPIRQGFSYTQEQIEAAIYSLQMRKNDASSTSLIERLAMAAFATLNEKKHLSGFFGSAAEGAVGLLNNPNVPVISSGSAVDVLNPATTSNEIYDWLVSLVIDIKKTNKQSQLYPTDTCLISLDLMSRLKTVDTTSGSDTSLYTILRNELADLGITRMMTRQEVGKSFLETYGITSPGTNEDMLMFFSSNPSSTYRKTTPVDLTPFHFDGKKYSQFFRQNVASVAMNYPVKALYAFYPNTI